MENKKSVVIMARVSSDEQAKGYSLDVQKEALEKYCEKHNLTVGHIIKEDHSEKSEYSNKSAALSNKSPQEEKNNMLLQEAVRNFPNSKILSS